MSFDVNNNSDPANSPGSAYTAVADSATTIQRKGPITYFSATGNLTASRVWIFGSVAAQGWTIGDVVFLNLPTHTGGGFTVTVQNIATTVLATWAALLANGGIFYFNGTDFQAMNPGQSTT